MAYYGEAHKVHTDWPLGADEATTYASLREAALRTWASTAATMAVIAITPTGQASVFPEGSSADAASFYDQIVELANQGQYIYVALFDRQKSATPDGMLDDTFTGVGIVQKTISVLVSPWVVAVGAAALVAVVFWDKKRKRGRR